MKWGRFRCQTMFVLLFVLSAAAVWPQASTSTVRGTVLDQSNAVVPKADVSLINIGTNITAKTVTNGSGMYVFPGVVPGQYRLTVESAGMQSYAAVLTVQVQTDAVVNPVLTVGTTATQVSVEDVTPLVTADVPTLGSVLDRARIDQLPINGRDVMSLLATVPGMEGGSSGQSETTRAFGLRSGSAEFVVDGASLNERVWGGIERRPPGLDTIQEFKVEENNSSAKFTRPTTIIMSTKSGTNQFHGALFETNRNSGYGVARQRTDFYEKPPQLNRNEFGASIGGPVVIPKLYNGKNKTFFFFGYEHYSNINPTTQGFQVPTDAMRQGDFRGLVDDTGQLSKIYDPNTTDPVTWNRQQFSYNGNLNVIDPSRESPLAKYLFGITPEPTLPNVNPLLADNWFGATPNTGKQWTTSTRIDHHFSDRDQVFGRYTQGDFSLFQQFGSQPMLNGVAGTHQQTAPSKNGAISYVHSFSPSLINELLVSASHERWMLSTGGSTNYDAQLGLPNPFNVNGWPGIYATGLDSYYFETENTNETGLTYYVLDDNLTKIHGRHEFQFGFHGRKDLLNTLPDQQQPQGGVYFGYGNGTSLYDPTSGSDNPQPLPYTGSALANMYIGSAQYTNQMVRGFYYMRASEYALYFQDNFKVNSRLTLNMGLRWEDRPALHEKNNSLVGYDPKQNAMVLGTSLENMYKMGMTTPTVVNAYEGLGVKFISNKQAGLPSNLMYGNPLDFAPRIGFAYRGGDGAKSYVLRGGYHISYFPVPLRPWIARMRLNTPQDAWFYNIPDDPAQAPDGIANYSMRSPLTTVAGLNSTNAISMADLSGIVPGNPTVTYFDPHQSEPMVQDWNLTFEKELMPNTLLRVSYLGNHSSNLEQFAYTNDATPSYIWYATQGVPLPSGTYADVATRPFYLATGNTTYGAMNKYQRSGWSNNQGGQVTLEHRFNKGYAFQFFYTLTNAMTAGGQGYSGSSAIIPGLNQFLPGAVPTNMNDENRFLNYQRDTTLPKHRLQWNWIVDLPFGKDKLIGRNSGRLLDKLIGGWQIAGLGSWRTNYFALPTNIYPNGNKIEVYGDKYPIQDCRSGACIPGYLWWNGYINPNLINSHDANGNPNGIEGVPSSYKPAGQPINPWPANPSTSDPMYPYYGTNTVWVTMKDGSQQRTTYNNNLNPWRNQYFPGPSNWDVDASLFKVIPITEDVRLRFNMDVFNVFNHPGTPTSVANTGILSTQASGQPARQMQLTLRLIF